MISSKRKNVIIVAAGAGRVLLGDGGARAEIWLLVGDFSRTRWSRNSWKWEKLHLASRSKWWFLFWCEDRARVEWGRQRGLTRRSWEVLPILSSSEVCMEESADGFESTGASCLQPCLFPAFAFPKLLCPPSEFTFLVLLSFLSPASTLSLAEMSLLEGAGRRKPLPVGTSSVALIYHSTSFKCFPSFSFLKVFNVPWNLCGYVGKKEHDDTWL